MKKTLYIFCVNLITQFGVSSYFQQEINELNQVHDRQPASANQQLCENDDAKNNCFGDRIPSSVVAKAKSKFPVLLRRQGFTRFYFLRHCDTPETLSYIIYGDESYADRIRSWNASRKWQPGQIIYYKAPRELASKRLTRYLNLYDEHPGRRESYTIQQGDNLQKIAQNYLGDWRSWRDIAFTNNITDPDQIRPGTTLTLNYLR